MDLPLPFTDASHTSLLFGWQALSLDEPKLEHIRRQVLHPSDTSWIKEVLLGLPAYLEKLRPISKEFHEEAETLLGDIVSWLTVGTHKSSFTRLQILLTPLTITHHLLQYVEFLHLKYPDADADTRFSLAQESIDASGFCTGLLSAYAATNAHDRQSFKDFGTMVIRMAMVCGLVVDVHNRASSEDAPVTGLALAWHSPEVQARIGEVLSCHPQAYCSVLFDYNRATLTVPRVLQAELKQQLQERGLTVVELDFDGRFHWPGHKDVVDQVLSLIDSELPFASKSNTRLIIPLSTDAEDQLNDIPQHHRVMRSVLQQAPNWYQTVADVAEKIEKDDKHIAITFGYERFIPSSLMKALRPRMYDMCNFEKHIKVNRPSFDTDIAIVGMACKVAGADNVQEFWELLCKGESQHRQVPPERFSFNTTHRHANGSKVWYGNFMNDHDTFDHKFFKKTPREAASMDPQQRQALQIAYQAVEQSGHLRLANPDKFVGCYMGLSAVDYENNVACHAPNAYSSTGTLRGFVAGKISHFFGWTGPGLTIDTACSSSAVAIHLACQAILNGECNAAVAGGVNIMTSPFMHQNLGAASFLSKTGQCKPFDAAADGYCRGEGCAAVFLKKLSTAVADGDNILGVIAGTAVQQNENCTPIVVPNAPSLENLFTKVIEKSHLRPEDIEVVEAHGTGTPVGDPAEVDAIRQALDNGARNAPVMLGSVKGLVGHLESTSGVVSLVKAILMINHGVVVPQPSFKTLNPMITLPKHIVIPTSLTPWSSRQKSVLINNYGASGSNASMVILQPPSAVTKSFKPQKNSPARVTSRPFQLRGPDQSSFSAYAAALRNDIRNSPQCTLDDISCSLARRTNSSFSMAHTFTCASIKELDDQLSSIERGTVSATTQPQQPPPVILCFGGQVAKSVGLSPGLVEECPHFRSYLERCDAVCRDLGAESIFPHVYSNEPIDDIVTLQSALFAAQYASAKCWIEAGAQPVTVIGHSFGELTAMAVAGVLSMPDVLKMIVARAKLIRDCWGPETGSMMAIEGSLQNVQNLVDKTNAAQEQNAAPLVIACFNSSTTFTLAGSASAIDAAHEWAKVLSQTTPLKAKKLKVTHAFHSALTEGLIPVLDEAAKSVTFKPPTIKWSRCSEKEVANTRLDSSFFGRHLRQPVYFDQTVRRLSERYPGAIWLEAGSNATITKIVHRALGPSAGDTFVAVNLAGDLATETTALWKTGINVTPWPHIRVHNPRATLSIPPYQFAKSKHWLELQEHICVTQPPAAPVASKVHDSWLTFCGYQDGAAQQHARFSINTTSPKFQKLMEGHNTAQTAPICPATVQIDIAIEALSQVVRLGSDFHPEISGITNSVPVCHVPSANLWLDLRHNTQHTREWQFTVTSKTGNTQTIHTSGTIIPFAKDLATESNLARYKRLVSHNRFLETFNSTDADNVMQGNIIYKAFADVVDYDEQYRGVLKLVGKNEASAGRVVKAANPASWFDCHMSDTFCQVGGIYWNCMTDRASDEMYICRGLERWMRSSELQGNRPESYHVLALHSGSSVKGSFLTDVFVFHPSTGGLLEVVLGLNFVLVKKSAISKTLLRLTSGGGAALAPTNSSTPLIAQTSSSMYKNDEYKHRQVETTTLPAASSSPRQSDGNIYSILLHMVAELSGAPVEEIQPSSSLADLGFDSLMGMEVVRELESKFKTSFSLDDAYAVTNMRELVQFVRNTVGHSTAESARDSHRIDFSPEPESSISSTTTTTSIITPADSSSNTIDVVALLAGFLGIEGNDISPTARLSDLGIDSLSGTELRAMMKDDFAVTFDDNIEIDGMTIADFDQLVKGAGPASATQALPLMGLQSMLGEDGVTTGPSVRVQSDQLSITSITHAFDTAKARVDDFIVESGCANHVSVVLPLQDELCIALVLEAFEHLGCSIQHAATDTRLSLPREVMAHHHLVQCLGRMIETKTGLVHFGSDATMIRTSQPYDVRTSAAIIMELNQKNTDDIHSTGLICHVGARLHDLLMGRTDGVKLIFGDARGRQLAEDFYKDWPLHQMCYRQLKIIIEQLVSAFPENRSQPFKIMELGAGTGGTTKWIVPMLAKLGRNVEYTFTDVSSSLVNQARRKFQREYGFMKFQAYDIEKEPSHDLLGTQHLIISSNAVHATPNLAKSTGNIRQALQQNGVLLMVETTKAPDWVDLVFGVFGGWWLSNDGRTHALADENFWERSLRTTEYGFVDWTSGSRPESALQRVIMAVACDPVQQTQQVSNTRDSVEPARQAIVDKYVDFMSSDLCKKLSGSQPDNGVYAEALPRPVCVVVTGGTGSLGSHFVADLAKRPEVQSIIVLNRHSHKDPMERQLDAFKSRDISFHATSGRKLQVFGTDTSQENLGLTQEVYHSLATSATHIIHQAWSMSINRKIRGFEPQFKTMRNLIHLAMDAANALPRTQKFGFQFVSSIAVVGHYPLNRPASGPHVTEERVKLSDVLPIGYADAKFACERALDETLHRIPKRFATSSVRIGQIAGANGTGYWNPQEHLPFVLKSSQTFGCLPELEGTLSWTPVDVVAGTLADIALTAQDRYPVYHIDNPHRQEWSHMLPMLAGAMSSATQGPVGVVPFDEWLNRVRSYSGPAVENPAAMIDTFIERDFRRMSCGGLVLDCMRALEHSRTLSKLGTVEEELVHKFIQFWKSIGFLQ